MTTGPTRSATCSTESRASPTSGWKTGPVSAKSGTSPAGGHAARSLSTGTTTTGSAPTRSSHQIAPIVAGEADMTGVAGTCVLELPDVFWTISPELHRQMFKGDIPGGTLAYRSSLIKEGLRYPDVDLAEDAALLQWALENGKRLTRLDNQGLFVYVRHGNNTWSFDLGSFVDPAGWSRIDPPASLPPAVLVAIQDAASGLVRSPERKDEGAAAEVVSPIAPLESIPIDRADVGYGALGVGGELGYEGGQVIAGGRPWTAALSAHAPSRLAFSIGGAYAHFRSGAALNDDVPAGRSRADFHVVGDGRIIASALGVVAGGPIRDVAADIRGVERLELVVETDRWAYCHSVWLNPVLDRQPHPRKVETLADCLGRTEIRLPAEHPRAERCVATVVSPGFTAHLDDLLGSLRQRRLSGRPRGRLRGRPGR